MQRRNRDPRRLGVLVLGRDGAEWRHAEPDGRSVHAFAPAAGGNPSEVAAAARAAIGSAGASRRPCVLALDADFVQHRLITLPALARRDLGTVLARKAANLLGVEIGAVLYQAVAIPPFLPGEGAVEAAPSETRWLLAAMRRAELRELRLALREIGVPVVRVVSARLAPLAAAQEVRGDARSACIVIGVERRAVTVSLIAGDTLFNQNVVEGSFSVTPTMAMTLIQEVRGTDAFWRKTSRGGSIGQVVLVGFERERAEIFRHAIATALPHARFLRAGEGLGEPHGGRGEALAACLARRAFQLELPVPLPPRSRTAAALIALVVAGCFSLSAVSRARIERESARVESEMRARRTESARLEEMEGERQRTEARLSDLARRLARANAAVDSGWPFADVVEGALSAFGGEATLMSIDARRREGTAELDLLGQTADDLPFSVARIERIARALEALPLLTAVQAEPSGGLPGARADGPPVQEFAIRARAGGAR